jgi:hypothetical protein
MARSSSHLGFIVRCRRLLLPALLMISAGGLGAPRPTVSALHVFPRSLRIARGFPFSLHVAYTLSAGGGVTFTVEQRGDGRLVRGRCVLLTHANRKHRACARALGSFTRTGAAGKNGLTFRGRVGGHQLGPGSYLLVATPSAGGQKGSSRTAPFALLP